MVNKLGRKVIAGAIILICGIGAVLLRGDIPVGFLTLLQTIFAAFVVGNAIEHVTGAVRSNAEARQAASDSSQEVAVPQQDNSELIARVDQLDANIRSVNEAVSVSNQSLNTIQQAVTYVISRAFPKG